MTDWIEQAKLAEDKRRAENEQKQRAREDIVRRLEIVFPEWLNSFINSVKSLCDELAQAFPQTLPLQYLVSDRTNGCVLTSGGFPQTTVEVAFHVETQQMDVRYASKQNRDEHSARPLPERFNQGQIKLSDDSQMYIEYHPKNSEDATPRRYSDPKQLASAMVREMAQL
jgi:hypothetical protein